MNIEVISKSGKRHMNCRNKESLQAAMVRQGLLPAAPCGGRGTCGKCRLCLKKGQLAVTDADRQIFSPSQLAAGMRLACQAYPTGDLTVYLCTPGEDDFAAAGIMPLSEKDGTASDITEGYGLAADIGTTTIVMVLTGLDSGRIYAEYSTVNHQRAFGADVVSRIKAANDGAAKALREIVQADLNILIAQLLSALDENAQGKIRRMVISANTTMIHLLMGYCCQGLGEAPFTPENLDTVQTNAQLLGICGLHPETPVLVLPGISAFVGADIVAGMLACGLTEHARHKPCLFIDLGTNGEMALCDGERLLAASAAAGPAFEGGNISCGVGSVSGAVCTVRAVPGDEGWKFLCQTIGGKAPVGLCGTGVLDAVAQLLYCDLLDETGLLAEAYEKSGVELAKMADGTPIVLTQKDIREFQLAKAAIRAGIEVLMQRFGVTCEQLGAVYIAGGFGFYLNIKSAVTVGLLPAALAEKTVVCGNTALKGAMMCLQQPERILEAGCLARSGKELVLAEYDLFAGFYMSSMFFQEENV